MQKNGLGKNHVNHHKLASIILLSYNSKDDLKECIPSLIKQTYTNYEIILVDNASSDNSPEFIRNNYPDIMLIETGSNMGYPAGNNIGFDHASGEYIVVLNPDTVTDSNWLAELIKPLEENPDIALTTSKILIYDEPDKINTCANTVHYTGLDFCRGFNEPLSSFSRPEEVGAISGCSFAIRREIFKELGGFDPEFFLYLDDVDLSWRARLAGYKIQFIPTSIVYHKFHLSIEPWKEFYLERNRYLMLLKNCSLRMLILMSPAFIVSEIVTWGHAVLHGYLYMYNKLRAYWWIFTNTIKIGNKRREVQKTQRISDKEFLRLLEWKVPFEQVIQNKIMFMAANIFFNSFYRIYLKFINIGLFGMDKTLKWSNFKAFNKNGLL